MKWFSPNNLEFTVEALWRDLLAIFGAVDTEIDGVTDRLDGLEAEELSITTDNDVLIIESVNTQASQAGQIDQAEGNNNG